MNIKGSSNSVSAFQKSKNLLGSRRGIIKTLVVLAGIMVFSVMFLAAISYGAFLQKRGQTPNLKNFLIAVKELDFAFIPNFVTGTSSEIDRFDIEMKFKHSMRIQYLREQAFEKGIIDEEIKSEEFPAKITVNGEEYDVKLNLSGLMLDHLRHPTKWSYEVRVKGDRTINGLKRFTLMFPRARGYLTDWVATEICKERGLVGLRQDFVDVNINGKPIGLYYMEERFDKYLLENNAMREGIIFKIGYPEINIYGENKMLEDPAAKEKVIRFRQLWQALVAGDLQVDQFFDLEKMAKLYAITDLMRDKHAISFTNLRLYFNPVTGLAEPIGREWEYLRKETETTMALFLEKPTPASKFHEITEADTLVRLIYDNYTFQQHYIKEAGIISKEEFLKNLFEKIKPRMNALMKKVYRENPFYKSPESILLENQNYIRKKLYSDLPEVSAYLYKKDEQELKIYLKNLQDLPVEVAFASWADTVFFLPAEQTILKSNWKTPADEVKLTTFKFPNNFVWADSMLNELELTYNILGLENERRKVLIFPWSYENRGAFAQNPVNRAANYQSFDFIKEEPGNNILRVPAGKWTIDRELIIPSGKELVFNPGAKIDIIGDGQIISKSPFNCLGTEEQPIVFYSSDSTGKGIFIMNAGKLSMLRYTTFDNLAPPANPGWSVSGSLTMYESPADISHCIFSSSRVGDDCLNIIRAEFEMEYTVFRNTSADAFDCDFCKGTINKTTFVNIGNDAMDVSGTDMFLNDIIIDKVGDKGLSAGENSRMTVKNVQIFNAEIALTSKDKSLLTVENAEIENCRVGITAFQKKSEFGPGDIVIKGFKMKEAEVPYLIEAKSSLKIDGEIIQPSRDNVKEILYGVEYGKASK